MKSSQIKTLLKMVLKISKSNFNNTDWNLMIQISKPNNKHYP